MTDIQSVSSVSWIKSHFLLGGSVVSFHGRQPTVVMPFLAVVFCWNINCPTFPGTKKVFFLSQKVIP